MKHGIAYTDDGSPPPHSSIVSWLQDDAGRDTTWDDRGEALEACENDGWRGYVCVYPTGERPTRVQVVPTCGRVRP